MTRNFASNNAPHSALVESMVTTELRQVVTVNHNPVWRSDCKWLALTLRHRSLVDIAHGQVRMIFLGPAKWLSLSPLLPHVLHVVGLCALKQMVKAKASRVIAMVQDVELRVHRAIDLFSISVPMRSVSRAIDRASPAPASVSLVDARPVKFVRHFVNLSLRFTIFNYALG